jgi:hypothetical protein
MLRFQVHDACMHVCMSIGRMILLDLLGKNLIKLSFCKLAPSGMFSILSSKWFAKSDLHVCMYVCMYVCIY